MNTPTNVVTRFAPSPTGFMHIGGVRTALFAFLWARRHGGTFILRIEDTDKAREVAGSIQHIQDVLRWLHITWDYGPDTVAPFGSCIQSERLESHREYAQRLINKGLAYPDPYTEEEVATFRERAKAENRPFLYRNHRPSTFMPWDGKRPLRFRVPEVKRYTWHDAVRGELSAGEEMLDDFIIIKGDGYPTYNFAHIIDDFEMGVTHIMRSDEFISSTPKFLSLYDALEINRPTFVTLPPILRDDRTKKLGKRDGAKDALEYRKEGYLPEAMVNFLALIGWNPGTDQEIFTQAELIKAFDISKIQKAGAAFNEEKLLWTNKQHLLTLGPADQVSYVRSFLSESMAQGIAIAEPTLEKLTPTIIERIQVGKDIRDGVTNGDYDFAFTTPVYDASLLLWKKDTNITAALPRLRQALTLLTAADFASAETIKAALWTYAEEVGKGELLWPLRVALSGKAQSPDPFTIAAIIGKEETLLRITAACDKIEACQSHDS